MTVQVINSVQGDSQKEVQVMEYIEETLVQNKNCKILQCHLNDYTDFVKVSFANYPVDNSVVYRVHNIQTKPNFRNTVTGYCDRNDFGKFVHDTIMKFASSVNQDKVYNDWETSFVIADMLTKRTEIKNWSGKIISNFVETIDEIVQEVVGIA
jgi:hypothetical protein